jgi:glycosyltransferase involved in cell wall biosynthesis
MFGHTVQGFHSVMNATKLGQIAAPTATPRALARPRLFPESRLVACHVVSAEQWAGAEAQIAMLLRQLAADTALSLSAIVLGEGRLGEELAKSGIETALIPNAAGRFLASFRDASRFLGGKQIDILHSHKSKENLLALLLAKRFRVPFLVRTRHGMPEPRTLKDRIVYRMESMTAHYVSRVIYVSADLKQRVASNASDDKVTVIRNAVDLVKVQSGFTVAEAKRRLEISPERPVIGIVGRLEAVKRVDLFLDVARFLLRELPSACFVIAGAGREEAALRNSLRGSELERQTLFLGERDDIYDVLRAMDLLLITSDHEGMPTVLLEALALGVPVVARNVGGIGEVISDDLSGRLVNSADAATIARASLPLIHASALRSRLIGNGIKTVQKFSAAENAANYMHVYQSLVSSSARTKATL